MTVIFTIFMAYVIVDTFTAIADAITRDTRVSEAPERRTATSNHSLVKEEVVEIDAETGAEEEQAEADKGLKSLALLIVEAQKAVDSCPEFALGKWHLDQSRDWFSRAKEKYTVSENYSSALTKLEVGNFHANLAIEVVSEYRARSRQFNPEPASPLDLTPARDNSPAHEVASTSANTSIQPPAPAAIELPDPVPFNVPAHVIPEALAEVTAEPAPNRWTPPDVQDRYKPDYCSSDDSDLDEVTAEWRKLSLLIARAQALIDAKLQARYPEFGDAQHYLNYALDYVKAAEEAKHWSDVPEIIADGLFFARLCLDTGRQMLAAHDISVSLPEAEWDNGDEEVDDSEEARSTISDLAAALVLAQVALARREGAPQVASYLLGIARNSLDEIWSAYWDENWDDAQWCAEQAHFCAALAAEAAEVYVQEYRHLEDGYESTIDDGFSNAYPDYTATNSDNDDVSEGRSQWRELALRVALLQAFLTVKCPLFNDGAAHLKSAQAYVEKVENTSDWEDIPAVVDSGNMFVEIAFAAANRYLNLH